MQITVNGTRHEIDADPAMPLLWVLRDLLGLTGTKYGCGEGLCGACTVHVAGRAVAACQVPVGEVAAEVTTIEGLPEGPVQAAWVAHQVAQCGYCQPGHVMAAAALLARTQSPTDAEIDTAMAGHVCRCGTGPRIRAAIHDAARRLREG